MGLTCVISETSLWSSDSILQGNRVLGVVTHGTIRDVLHPFQRDYY